MELLKELRRQGHQVLNPAPQVHCKVFEDNSGALDVSLSQLVTVSHEQTRERTRFRERADTIPDEETRRRKERSR